MHTSLDRPAKVISAATSGNWRKLAFLTGPKMKILPPNQSTSTCPASAVTKASKLTLKRLTGSTRFTVHRKSLIK